MKLSRLNLAGFAMLAVLAAVTVSYGLAAGHVGTALAEAALLFAAAGLLFGRAAARRARVRPEVASPAPAPKTLAESVAEAVEAQRAAKWAAVMEQAFLAAGGPAAAPGRRQSPIPPDGEVTASHPAPRSPGSYGSVQTGAGLGAGISTELAGARLSAAFGRCAHPDAEPVDLASGERVAWVCADPECSAQLPADWR